MHITKTTVMVTDSAGRSHANLNTKLKTPKPNQTNSRHLKPIAEQKPQLKPQNIKL